MTTTTNLFSELRTVAVPVSDLDASRALFEGLGLSVRFDQELQPGFRWIELGFGTTTTSLALVLAGDELPVGIDTGVRLTTPDARAAHDALRELGLDVGELLDWPTAPLMFSFLDPDANRFYVSEVDRSTM